MKLTLINYNSQTGVFSFYIQANISEENQLYQLQTDLNRKLNFYPNSTVTVEKKFLEQEKSHKITFKIHIQDSYNTFLFDTRKCFMDAGITIENWNEFVDDCDLSQLSITLYKTQGSPGRGFFALSKDPIQHLKGLLALRDISALQITSTNTQRHYTSIDYKSELKIQFPDYYDRVNLHGDSSNHSAEKSESTFSSYEEAFKHAYSCDYVRLKESQKKLFTLFKTGNLDAIKNASFTIRDLFEFSQESTDNMGRGLLTWARLNEHQAILDYCYTAIIEPYFRDTMVPYKAYSTTILHWALLCCQNEVVITDLVENKKINIDAKCFDLQSSINAISALYIAVYLKNVKLVQYLVQKGANILETTKNHKSALEMAIVNGNLEIIQILLQALNPPGMHVPFQINNPLCNTRDYPFMQQTPLMLAASYNRLEIVKYFIEELNANVNVTTDNGTPLTIAILKKHTEVMHYLVEEAKANINLASDGQSPLGAAISVRNGEIVRYLLEKKADPNLPNQHYLRSSIVTRQFAITHLLLDFHASASLDRKILIYAAQQSAFDIVQRLVAGGAPLMIMWNNHTAFTIVAENNQLEIAIYLISQWEILQFYLFNSEYKFNKEMLNGINREIKEWVKTISDHNPMHPLQQYVSDREALNHYEILSIHLLKQTEPNKISGALTLLTTAFKNLPRAIRNSFHEFIKLLEKISYNLAHPQEEKSVEPPGTSASQTSTALPAALPRSNHHAVSRWNLFARCCQTDTAADIPSSGLTPPSPIRREGHVD